MTEHDDERKKSEAEGAIPRKGCWLGDEISKLSDQQVEVSHRLRLEMEEAVRQAKWRVLEVGQHGNVMVTLWYRSGVQGMTGFMMKFDRSGDFTPDGLPLAASDWKDVSTCLFAVCAKLEEAFREFQLDEDDLPF